MGKTTIITVSIEKSVLKEMDSLIKNSFFSSRSQVARVGIQRTLQKPPLTPQRKGYNEIVLCVYNTLMPFFCGMMVIVSIFYLGLLFFVIFSLIAFIPIIFPLCVKGD